MNEFDSISFDFLQDKIREELHPTSGPGHQQKMLEINKKRIFNEILFGGSQKTAIKGAEAEAVSLIKNFKKLMKKTLKILDSNLKAEGVIDKLDQLS
jgi:hypothetical protein